MLISISTSSQSESAKMLFGTAKFIPKLKEIAKYKSDGINVDKVIQLLNFLAEATDADLFDFKDSGKTKATLKHIETVCGKSSLGDMSRALNDMYVPLVSMRLETPTVVDVKQEMKAIGQKLVHIKPANTYATTDRKVKHPNAVHDVGTRTIKANR